MLTNYPIYQPIIKILPVLMVNDNKLLRYHS
jgi:hypothetical protein